VVRTIATASAAAAKQAATGCGACRPETRSSPIEMLQAANGSARMRQSACRRRRAVSARCQAAIAHHRHARQPDRLEQRARRGCAVGELEQVRRIGHGEQREAGAEQRPREPAPAARQPEEGDHEREQQQVAGRIGGVHDQLGAQAARAGQQRPDHDGGAQPRDRQHADEPVEPHARRDAAHGAADVQAQAQVGERVEGEPAGVGERRQRRLPGGGEERVEVRVARHPQAEPDREREPGAAVRVIAADAERAQQRGADHRELPRHGVDQQVGGLGRAGAGHGVRDVRPEREQQQRGERRGGPAAAHARALRGREQVREGCEDAIHQSGSRPGLARVEEIWTDRRGAGRITGVTALPDDVRALFEGANYAHLATVLPSGAPHSVPVWTGIEGEHVAFFTQPSSRKARNLERDPRVAFSITDHDQPYRMAQVRGRVAGTVEGEAALEIIDRLAVKYTGNPFPMRSGVVFLIEPERVQSMTLPFDHAPA
jgi:PPOX class probable F420-dependent enzyme